MWASVGSQSLMVFCVVRQGQEATKPQANENRKRINIEPASASTSCIIRPNKSSLTPTRFLDVMFSTVLLHAGPAMQLSP